MKPMYLSLVSARQRHSFQDGLGFSEDYGDIGCSMIVKARLVVVVSERDRLG